MKNAGWQRVIRQMKEGESFGHEKIYISGMFGDNCGRLAISSACRNSTDFSPLPLAPFLETLPSLPAAPIPFHLP